MILVTGGAGYIGSHTVLTLQQHGHDVLVLDNLCNSSAEAIYRVNRLTGKNARLIEGDIRDRALLDQILGEHPIRAVIHFAGLKAVGESVQKPLAYYDNNVGGSITLIEAMQAAGVKNLVFSSSATVYGEQGGAREYTETMPLGVPSSPYGKTKVMIETILGDTAHADPAWTIALLRYFNPVGAHESGDIGEDPQGIPNNLVPYISQVAVGRLERLAVYGDDYDTPDGTCLRDYIHVFLENGQPATQRHVFAKGQQVVFVVAAAAVAEGDDSVVKKLFFQVARRNTADQRLPARLEIGVQLLQIARHLLFHEGEGGFRQDDDRFFAREGERDVVLQVALHQRRIEFGALFDVALNEGDADANRRQRRAGH